MFKGKTLLITGGTGSFGSTVLKRFIDSDIAEIRIFSRDEKKQDDMRTQIKNDKVKFYIGDVRNLESVRDAMKGVDYVFHAAALKQVPSCEFFPMEAVRTNVLGTDNVLTAAIDAKVKRVVCLSTDKAAYPINAMGTSKAMMEKVIVAKSRNVDPEDTTICCTRYGNVMASRGSVIPLFTEQIRKKEVITITDPTMTRFLMNLDEAVDLVLFAFKNARQGDLFIQKAPAATIETVAQALQELYHRKTEVKIIGTRHGEKAHETLMTREERAKSEDLGGFYRIPADNRDLNYDKYFVEGDHTVETVVEYASDNAERLDVEGTKAKLLTASYVQEAVKTFPRTVLVTGASGFLGKNLCARLALEAGTTVIPFTRQHTDSDLQNFVAQADFIFHLAAVMRPTDQTEFTTVNTGLTSRILELASQKDQATNILITSSVHAEGDSDYGKSKKVAEDAVYAWEKATGNTVYVFRLPNVFGKWARPNYSSVVATFCHNIAHGLPVEVHDPSRELSLSYVDDVVDAFMRALNGTIEKQPQGQPYSIARSFPTTLGDLAEKIYALETVRKQHDMPVFETAFETFLYATYLSYVDNDQLGYSLDTTKSLANIFLDSPQTGRLFIYRTNSGTLTMEPQHQSVVKKILVLQGSATIKLDNPYTDTTASFEVTGNKLWAVDVPAGCSYAIQPKGQDELVALCWLGDIPFTA